MFTSIQNYFKDLKLLAEVQDAPPSLFQAYHGRANRTYGVTLTDRLTWKASAKVHELTDRPTLEFEVDVIAAVKALKRGGSAKETPESQELLLAKQNETRSGPLLRDSPSSIAIYGDTKVQFIDAVSIGFGSTLGFIILAVLYKNNSKTDSSYCNVKKPIVDAMDYFIYTQNREESKSTFRLSYLLPTNFFNTEEFIENCARKNDKRFDQKSVLEKQVILYETYQDFVKSNKRFSALFTAGSQIDVFLVITPTIRYILIVVLRHYIQLKQGLLVDIGIIVVSASVANQAYRITMALVTVGMGIIWYMTNSLINVFILRQHQGEEEKRVDVGEEEKRVDVGGELDYGL